jgi:hypothetical protein
LSKKKYGLKPVPFKSGIVELRIWNLFLLFRGYGVKGVEFAVAFLKGTGFSPYISPVTSIGL